MSIKEIGSVFHACTFQENVDYIAFPKDAYYYGCGRYAINALIKHHLNKKLWRRLFVPEYFCYEVIDSIRSTGIEVVFYPDFSFADDQTLVTKIKFREGDVLLRMNYFGLRNFRDNSDINAIVIEDHSHNLFSDWALNSNADWCIASLRKTLPIPDGGILWSPKKDISLIEKPLIDSDHSKLSEDRSRAMKMKGMYLDSIGNINKDDFLQIFCRTEKELASTSCPAISSVSEEILNRIPESILQKKSENYMILIRTLLQKKCLILQGEEKSSPFSLVILFNSKSDRDSIREALTRKNIYSTILWEIRNDKAREEAKSFSQRMLSLPIDFRYSESDIRWMSQVVNAELLKI
jgi:hypothetical protein